jgi:hypothetical protein
MTKFQDRESGVKNWGLKTACLKRLSNSRRNRCVSPMEYQKKKMMMMMGDRTWPHY